MDKQHGKSVRKTRRRTGGRNTHRFSQNNSKKIPIWKTPGHDCIHRFWFKKFTSIYDRLLFSLQLWVNSRTDWFLQPW